MYETLSYLPQVLLNQTYESYIAQHIFNPLNMSSSTFSVAEAEARGTLAHGFQWDAQDITQGKNGTLVATVPYFQRPGEEEIWAGAGGVLTSARDLVRGLEVYRQMITSKSIFIGYLGIHAPQQWTSSVYQRNCYTLRSC